jgi:hypothetical protein
MARGSSKVCRGVVVLSLVLADPTGCAAGRPAVESAGWTARPAGGPEPGQLGPAVIAGHVDSRTGPAVFYRLHELRAGEQVRVLRADRRVVVFRVESLARHPRQALPGAEVFGPTTAPFLRLITCAGSFDRSRQSDRANLVVSARVTGDPGRDRGGEAEQ